MRWDEGIGLEPADTTAYWRHLQLEREPFGAVDGRDGYYIGARGQELLAALQQQLLSGHAVQLVCGYQGMGKTSLCQQLQELTAEDFFPCLIDAEQGSDAHTLFARIVECYGLTLPAGEPGSFIKGLQAQLGTLREQRQPLLLVDNAQQFGDDTLELLLHLATLGDEEGVLMRLVLFSEPEITSRLSAPRFAAFPKTERLDIQGLEEQEIGAYLLHRLRVAGYDGELPFQARELRQVAMANHGNPAAINVHARLLLGEKRHLGRFVLWRHPAAGVLAVGVLLPMLIGVLVWRGAAEEPLADPACQESGVAALVDGTHLPCSESAALAPPPAPGEGAGLSDAEPQPRQASLAQTPAEPSPPVHAPQDRENVAIQDAVWLSEQPADYFTLQLMVSKERDNLHKLARQYRLQGPLAEFVTRREGVLLYVLTQGSYAERAEAEQAGGTLPEGLSPWVRTLGSVQQAMYTGSVPPVAEAPVRTAPDNAASQPRDVVWIWSQNPAHYTLQVAAGPNGEAVREKLEASDWPGEQAVIRTRREGRDWYIAVLGNFGGVEAARQAMAGLPQAVRRDQPWPRDFASLQEEMSRATP